MCYLAEKQVEMSAATFENPLIPNQRLKQLYNAMRDLRSGSKRTRGLEAGIAATANHLRPQDKVTDMKWTPNEDQKKVGMRIKNERKINPPTHCSTCHR